MKLLGGLSGKMLASKLLGCASKWATVETPGGNVVSERRARVSRGLVLMAR